jgi:hypothetical protein
VALSRIQRADAGPIAPAPAAGEESFAPPTGSELARSCGQSLSSTVKATWSGVTLADSDRTVLVEANR